MEGERTTGSHRAHQERADQAAESVVSTFALCVFVAFFKRVGSSRRPETTRTATPARLLNDYLVSSRGNWNPILPAIFPAGPPNPP